MRKFLSYLHATRSRLFLLVAITIVSSLFILVQGDISLEGITLTPSPLRFMVLHLLANLLFYFILEGLYNLSTLTGRFGVIFLILYAVFIIFNLYSIVDVVGSLDSDDWKLYIGLIIQISIWIYIPYIQGKKLFLHLRELFKKDS